jgi:hypothetical protein
MLGMWGFQVSKPDPDTLVIRMPRFILIADYSKVRRWQHFSIN